MHAYTYVHIYHCHWHSGRGIILTEKLFDNQSVIADIFMLEICNTIFLLLCSLGRY